MFSGRARLLVVLILSPGSAGAAQWVTVGPRALGMGGAYTAVAEGPVGAYYNPGMLGQETGNPSGFELQASGRYEIDGSAIEGANDLYEVANQCRSGGGPLCTDANVRSALVKMSGAGQGALAEAAGGINFKFGRLAVFANNFSFRGATPAIDLVNASAATVASNQSKLRMRGASFYEFGAGYGREILESGVFIGANLKGIVGKLGYTDFFVGQENPDVGALERNYARSGKTSFRPGIDLGLLWDVRETFPAVWGHPRFGVVGRNLNAPRFTLPGRAQELGDASRLYALHGQSRAGLAFDPLRHWTVSADLDLTENLTMVEGYASRTYAVGTEVRAIDDPSFSLPLRAGVSKNIAQGNSGALYHAGFGLQFTYFRMDFAGAVAGRRYSVQSLGKSQKLPHQLAASVQLSLLFGGAESITEPSHDPYAPAARTSPTYNFRDPFR